MTGELIPIARRLTSCDGLVGADSIDMARMETNMRTPNSFHADDVALGCFLLEARTGCAETDS
jgi:hypothetical protein